jgi:hypothetical protein
MCRSRFNQALFGRAEENLPEGSHALLIAVPILWVVIRTHCWHTVDDRTIFSQNGH